MNFPRNIAEFNLQILSFTILFFLNEAIKLLKFPNTPRVCKINERVCAPSRNKSDLKVGRASGSSKGYTHTPLCQREKRGVERKRDRIARNIKRAEREPDETTGFSSWSVRRSWNFLGRIPQRKERAKDRLGRIYLRRCSTTSEEFSKVLC